MQQVSGCPGEIKSPIVGSSRVLNIIHVTYLNNHGIARVISGPFAEDPGFPLGVS